MIEIYTNRIYKHWKGASYLVKFVGRDSNDCHKLIVGYESLEDSDFPAGTLWIRDLEEFVDTHPSGNKRFELQPQESPEKRSADITEALNAVYTESKMKATLVERIVADPTYIKHVGESDCFEELQVIAVRADPKNVLLINNPTDLVKRMAIEKNPALVMSIQDLTDDDVKTALRGDGELLELFDTVSEDMILTALYQNGMALRFVNKANQTREMYNVAVKQNPKSIQYMGMQYEDILLQALKISRDGELLEMMHNQTHRVCKYAVGLTLQALRHINDVGLRSKIQSGIVTKNNEGTSKKKWTPTIKRIKY